MSKIYQLNLTQSSGILTQLQSDTIFGHFCWRFIEYHGEEIFKDFLNNFLSGNPIFTVSDAMISLDDNIFFPKPLKAISTVSNGEQDVSRKDKIIQMMKYKEEKSKKFSTVKEMNSFLNNEELTSEDLENVPEIEIYLKMGVAIDRNTFTAKEGQLFSHVPYFLKTKKNTKNHSKDSKATYVLFIKTLHPEKFEEFKCKEILEDVFKVGFGKRKSVGYGEFSVGEFIEFDDFKEPEDAKGFITLSNYLPCQSDQINLANSNYDSFVKYGKLGESFALSADPFKKPLVLFKPGSTFSSSVSKDYYGKCTSIGELNEANPNVIQNGIAFTLKCKL